MYDKKSVYTIPQKNLPYKAFVVLVFNFLNLNDAGFHMPSKSDPPGPSPELLL